LEEFGRLAAYELQHLGARFYDAMLVQLATCSASVEGNLDDFVSRALEMVCLHLKVHSALVWLTGRHGTGSRGTLYVHRRGDSAVRRSVLEEAQGPTSELRTCFADNLHLETSHHEAHGRVSSRLDVAVVVNGSMNGFIRVEDDRPGAQWTHEQIAFLRQISLQIVNLWHREENVAHEATSRRRVEQTLAAIQAGLWSLYLRTGRSEWSPECYEVFGRARELPPPTQSEFFALVHPDDRVLLTTQPDKDFRHRELEFRVVRDSGEVGWVRDSYSVELGDDGTPARLHGIAVDITQQKATQVALTASELRLSYTNTAVGGGMWELELPHGQRHWSGACADMLQVPSGSLPGRDVELPPGFLDAIHPFDQPKVAQCFAGQATHGDRMEVTFRVQGRDGCLRWCHNVAELERDESGQPWRWRGLLLDVSELKRAEVRAKRLAMVASRTVSAVAITDEQGRVEWVNEAFVSLTGYSFEEMKGQKPGTLLQGPGTDPATVEHMRKCIRRGEGFRVELLNYSRTGRQYWVDLEVQTLSDEDGRIDGFMSLETDVTDRRLRAQRDRLQTTLSSILLTSDSFSSAAPALVKAVVESHDLVAAHLWAVVPAQPTLEYLAGYVQPALGDAGRRFLEATAELEFHRGDEFVRGVGMPGVAWSTGRTQILSELTGTSRRKAAADAISVSTMTVVPLNGPDGVIGVLEVDGPALYPGHDELPALLESLCEQLSQFVLRSLERSRFSAIFEQSPDALLLIDERGVVKVANTAARNVFGDVGGGPIQRFVEGLDSNTWLSRDDPRPRLTTYDRFGVSPGGARFPVDVSVARARGLAAMDFIVAVRDLSGRRRMELELASERERLRVLETRQVLLERLLAGSPVAMLVVGTSSEIRQANQEAHRLFSDASGALLKRRLGDLLSSRGVEFGGPGGAPLHVVFRPDGPRVVDVVAKSFDGREFPAELRISQVSSEADASFLVVFTDLTVRKRVEATLAAARDEAESAVAAKGQFLATMSHELRTPLNAVLGVAESLHEGVYGDVTSVQRTAIETIERSGLHLLSLIDDVLDIAKVDAGTLTLNRTDVDVADLCRESLVLIRERAAKRLIRVRYSNDGSTTVIVADRRRLLQVLLNLLSNAEKFTPASGTIGLDVRTDLKARLLVITVSDNGIGISEADQFKLFRPFVQLEAGLARKYQGTGLGLSLVSRFVESHGGRVSLKSSLGKGSEFSVFIPIG